MNDRVGIVVVCRLNSQRLPKKAILPLGKLSVIGRCLLNCTAVENAAGVVCATSTTDEDRPLAEETFKINNYNINKRNTTGVLFYAGHENSAIRLLEVATQMGFNHVVRITGDSPMISPTIIHQMINSHISNDADYSYTMDPPLGCRCEVIKSSALEKLSKLVNLNEYGEYLTCYFKNNNIFDSNNVNLEKYQILYGSSVNPNSNCRLNVDYEEDYKFVTEVCNRLIGDYNDINEIIHIISQNLNLLTINSNIIPKYESDKNIQEKTNIIPPVRIKCEAPIDFFTPEFGNHKIVDNFEADVLIPNPGSKYLYDESYLSKFSNLKIISTPSTGVTHIDLDYCHKNNIKVLTLLLDRKSLNNIHASAEFTWLHVLNSVRHFYDSVNAVKNRRWRDVESNLRGHELHGRNLGIIGFGRIGSKIAKFARSFGMNVLFYDPHVSVMHNGLRRYTKLVDIAKNSDVITINAYLTNETKGMIDMSFFDACKTGTCIINTSRGEIVNEEDVCHAVLLKKIKYSTDVVQNEQNLSKFYESKLYQLFLMGKVIITPHIAGATVESQEKAMESTMKILNRHLIEWER